MSVNSGRVLYRIWPAHLRARECAKRPKTRKLNYAPLAERVSEDLLKLWSPEEIAARLMLEFPEESRMQLSHESIYQSLYVQGRGELRRELARCLRYGHTTHQSQGRVKQSGRIANMINISERPGNENRTRTLTACCANTCPRAPTSRSTREPTYDKFKRA